MDKNKIAVIYLDKNRFDLYRGPNLGTLTCVFPQTVVKNLEIVNPLELEKLLKSFIDVNKLTLTNLIIVLSPEILFTKEIKKEDQENQNKEVAVYLDSIPFENVSVKLAPTQNGHLILATNQDYYTEIVKFFAKYNFPTVSILPIHVIDSPDTIQNGLDENTAKKAMEKYLVLSQFNLLDYQQNEYQKDNTQKQDKTFPKKNLRLFILLGIFLFLLFVLGGIVLINVGNQSNRQNYYENYSHLHHRTQRFMTSFFSGSHIFTPSYKSI
ncbi:hypothetical protein HYW54_04410 [Candidatus Gottesmanbacteria bacterium]|nr:hypothetical protein [Candidatus Gottesmanbacteria bacterium]